MKSSEMWEGISLTCIDTLSPPERGKGVFRVPHLFSEVAIPFFPVERPLASHPLK